jgi:hypothetical protein
LYFFYFSTHIFCKIDGITNAYYSSAESRVVAEFKVAVKERRLWANLRWVRVGFVLNGEKGPFNKAIACALPQPVQSL